MTTDLNLVMISGRLTKEPELKTVQSGRTLCLFSLGVGKYMGKDKPRKTVFVDCVAFNKTAQTIQAYFHRGDEIFVQGRIEAGVNKASNGATFKNFSIIVSEFWFGNKKTNGTATANGNNEEAPMPTDDDMYAAFDGGDDELPF